MTIQSDLSQLIVTSDDIVSALWSKLNPDSILQGINYLNGTNRVFKLFLNPATLSPACRFPPLLNWLN